MHGEVPDDGQGQHLAWDAVWCWGVWIVGKVSWLVGGRTRRVGAHQATGLLPPPRPNTKQTQQAVALKQHIPEELRWHGVLRDVDEGVRGQHAAELVAGVVDDGVLP